MIAEIIGLLILLVAVYIASTIWQLRCFPPGPFPLPLVGNLLSIEQNRPYAALANMAKKYGKLVRIHMGRRKVIVINSYEIAREALVTKAEDFAGRPRHFFGNIFGRDCTDIVFQTFNKTWKKQHKLALSALRLAEAKANMTDHAERLCIRFQSLDGKPFYPHDLVFNSLANCLSSLIFGEEHKLDDCEIKKLVNATHVFRDSLGAANLLDTFPVLKYIPFNIIKKAKRAGEIRDEIFERKFGEHVSTYQEDNIRDLMDAMLKGFHEMADDGLVTKKHVISR